MTASSVASHFFFCLLLLVLLLPARSAAVSPHGSYKIGSRQIVFKKTAGRSSGNSMQASTVPSTWSSMPSSVPIGGGLGSNNNKPLPVVHRQSQWSPLHGSPSLTALDVLRHDTSRIRRRIPSPSSLVAQKPTPVATTIPTNGSSLRTTLPGTLYYSVLVSYGTPEQQFPVFLDTNNIGLSLLQCKPCTSGSDDCDPAFDTSRSSTFAHVLCGSPDCPTNNCSSGTVCQFENPKTSTIVGPFAEDVLTLTPSVSVHNFRFVCLGADGPYDDQTAGILDLSRNPNSLPSRLAGASPIVLSYCLPQSPSSQGFLSIGDAIVRNDDHNVTTHATLLSSTDPELSSMYFIDLVGISLGGENLPIPAGTFSGNASANLDLGTTFTMLAPAAYAALRDGFQKGMSQYNNLSVPGFAGFDTCYNFTGLHELVIPAINFLFSNGESWLIDVNQMFYYDGPDARRPFAMTCLAFSSLDADEDVFSAVIGTYTLASTEVVYDVAGGKVDFIPGRC